MKMNKIISAISCSLFLSVLCFGCGENSSSTELSNEEQSVAEQSFEHTQESVTNQTTVSALELEEEQTTSIETTTETKQSFTLDNDFVIDQAKKCRYSYSMFSITIEEIVSLFVEDVSTTILQGEEIVENGYLDSDDILEKIPGGPDHIFYVIIAGNCMISPQNSYLRRYNDSAILISLIFDDNCQVVKEYVGLNADLKTCTLQYMTQ